LINQEFREIPLDGRSHDSTQLRLEEAENRMSIRSIHLDLLKHLKFDFVLLYKFADFLLRMRFLTTELVAWESQDLKAPWMQLVVQLNEFRVITGRQTSERCNVHYQENVALEFRKRDDFL